jgi:hypothetical protein
MFLTPPEFTNRRVNAVHDAVKILPDINIPDPQHLITFGSKPCITRRVLCPVFVETVLTSVDLDHQPVFVANKIDNIFAERRLSAEMETLFAPAAQNMPDQSFVIGHVVPQGLGTTRHGQTLSQREFTPHPYPSPQGGGERIVNAGVFSLPLMGRVGVCVDAGPPIFSPPLDGEGRRSVRIGGVGCFVCQESLEARRPHSHFDVHRYRNHQPMKAVISVIAATYPVPTR